MRCSEFDNGLEKTITIMKEEIINGIKYRLDEDNLTAEVVQLKDDFELDEASLTTEKLMKMIN